YYGHTHAYEIGAHPDAPFHLVESGGGGCWLDRWGLYSNNDYPEIHKSFDHYGYTILDFDLADRSYVAKTYSLGHKDLPRDNVLVDEFHQKRENTSAPQIPKGLAPLVESTLSPTLVATPYAGAEEVMGSHFQLTSTSGDYSSPIVDSRRDWVNFYGDTGAPNYDMVDLNDGIDLGRLVVSSGVSDGNTYFWRIRYRDQNLVWSEWSAEQSFSVNSGLAPLADFAANPSVGYTPLAVCFTDLSIPQSSSWGWDLDGDGSPDSTERDPQWSYANGGDYDITLITDSGTETKPAFIHVVTFPERPYISIQSGANQVDLTWPENASYETYQVYKALELGGSWEFITETTQGQASFGTDTTNAFYKVIGVLQEL
ncbi:MAG: PKD domain-containing protein, partial [Methylococcales bacterium]|nr:PKD domain-containing protein [Methylococcales bacterium]